jgi:hypothetical protein
LTTNFQAMSDFKIMFPSMDGDVIEAVLRANGGAVDATIDNLLTMSADAEAIEQVRSELFFISIFLTETRSTL